MAREVKVDEAGLERLRHLHEAEGWSLKDLAEEYSISRQYASRLVRGAARPRIGVLDAQTLRSGVLPAVERHLSALRLDSSGEVLAATARALATQLDACSVSAATGAAAALPRLADQLVEVLRRLQEDAPREPSPLDELVASRDGRRLAIAAREAGS